MRVQYLPLTSPLTQEGVREVFMFSYVGWPDFDVPTRTAEFVNFIYNIRHMLFVRPTMGPIVCHCRWDTSDVVIVEITEYGRISADNSNIIIFTDKVWFSIGICTDILKY